MMSVARGIGILFRDVAVVLSVYFNCPSALCFLSNLLFQPRSVSFSLCHFAFALASTYIVGAMVHIFLIIKINVANYCSK